jgi:chromosome segregation ATPase
MGNLAAYSRKELEGMISALQEQVGTNAGNMGADEIQAYYEALERLVDQYDKLESPFQKGEINDLIEYIGLQKQLNQEKEKEVALEQRKTDLNVRLELLQAKLASQQASGDTQGANVTQGLIKDTVNELKEVDGQLVSVTSNISVISEKVANLGDGMVKSLVVAQKVVNEIANIAEASTKMFDDIKSAADALGADTESGGWAKAGYAMEMVGGVSSELTSGLANLASGNFAGALANVVGIVTKLISGFAKIHDQNYQDIIEAQAKEVERLGKAYEKLEKATEDAYSIEQLQQANKELERNVELQMQALRAMIAAERAKKNTDEEQIAAWNEELEALTQQWEDLKQSLVEGVGGVSDYRSQTREFVDSWVSAFQETGDGLSGLQKDFREFFDNIIAEQAALRVTEKFLEPFYESLNTSLEDLKLTEEESKNLREEADKIMPELSKALELIWNQLGGSRGEADGGSLSALQKGIQGITEDTAQIIEAYLNSIRGYVSEQVTHTKNIYRILNDAVHSDAAAIRVRMV